MGVKESIKKLNTQYRQMPQKVHASLFGNSRARAILYQEKKMAMDCLKLLAGKAEEWLLDILVRERHDLRDIRQVLLLIMKQSGAIQRIDNDCVRI